MVTWEMVLGSLSHTISRPCGASSSRRCIRGLVRGFYVPLRFTIMLLGSMVTENEPSVSRLLKSPAKTLSYETEG